MFDQIEALDMKKHELEFSNILTWKFLILDETKTWAFHPMTLSIKKSLMFSLDSKVNRIPIIQYCP